eukprot:gene4146-biopygen6857
MPAPVSCDPWGHRTLARAWRGHGAGVARAIGIFLLLGWRGRGAGVARACPVTPGVTGHWRGRGAGVARAWRGLIGIFWLGWRGRGAGMSFDPWGFMIPPSPLHPLHFSSLDTRRAPQAKKCL